MKSAAAIQDRFLGIFLFLFIATYFLTVTGFLDRGKHWFSPHLTYRYQTDAFLQGRLTLQQHPRQILQDWTWGVKGVNHVWGLGVPILRLPFEIMAKVIGAGAFPDRLVFVFVYLTAAYQLTLAFIHVSSSRSELIRIGEAAVTTTCVILSPILLTFLSTRFFVFEEAVAYQALWSLLMLALLLRFFSAPTPARFLCVALAAAFAPLIRPTGIFYASTTILIAVIIAAHQRLSLRWHALALLIWTVGPLFVLVTNQLRFGDPFEFGYALSASYIAANNFSLRFGYPYQNEPFLSASKELFAALFLNYLPNGNGFYDHNIHPWFSSTLRFREYYLPNFGLVGLALVIASWLRSSWILLRANFDKSYAATYSYRVIVGMVIWSTANFFILALFYLRAPSLTSRYLFDFYPALAAAIAALVWSAFPAIRRKTGKFYVWILLIVFQLLVILSLGNYYQLREQISQTHQARTPLAKDELLARVSRSVSQRALPVSIFPQHKHYECAPGPVRTLMPAGITGWRQTGSCSVSAITTLFLPASPCVTLRVAVANDQSHTMFNADTGHPLTVWSSNYPLTFKSAARDYGGYKATFCHDQAEAAPALRLIAIGWQDPAKLTARAAIPFALYEVAAEQQ